MKLLILIICFVSFMNCATIKSNESVQKFKQNMEEIRDENEEKLNIIRGDISEVGVNLENLAFDLIKEFFTTPKNFLDFNQVKEKFMSTPIMKNVLKNIDVAKIVETTTEYFRNNYLEASFENTTESTTSTSDFKEKGTPINMLLYSGEDVVNKRRKRSARNMNEDDGKFVSKSTNKNLENGEKMCSPKSLKEQKLERQHIEDLKLEVKKLHDLVLLLKEQQQIMNILDDNDTNNFDGLPKNDSKDLIKILEHLNKDMDMPSTREENNEVNDIKPNLDTRTILPNHEELQQIKVALSQAISTLNHTKKILAFERQKEDRLESELRDQKMEINFIKMMVGHLYKNNTNFENNKGRSNDEDEDFVSLAFPHFNFTPPIFPGNKVKSSTPLKQTSDKIKSKSRTSENKERQSTARESELAELIKVLDTMNKDKSNSDDIQSKMLDLQQEINKKTKQEEMAKQLIILQKLMKESKSESKSLDNDNSDLALMKKLQKALSAKPQSKSDDLDIDNLSDLQTAINGLRPKQDLDLDFDDDPAKSGDSRQFEFMLNKLIGGAGFNKQIQLGGGGKRKPQLSPQQIFELKKQMGMYQNFGNGNDGYGPGGHGFGYGPFNGASDIYGNGQYGDGNYGPALPNLGPAYGPGPVYSGRPYAAVPPIPNPVPYFGPNYPSKYDSINSGYKPNSYNGIPPTNTYPGYSGPSPPKNYPNFGYSPSVPNNGPGYSGAAPYNTAGPSYNQNLGPNAYSNMGPTNYPKKPYDAPPISYSKSVDQYPPPKPGYQDQNKDYSQNGKSQLFLAPQSNAYDKSAPPENTYSGGSSDAPNQEKPYSYQDQNSVSSSGAYQQYPKIDDLKTQIYNLQSVINNLNRPEYVKKPDDQNTIYNLEQQINNLKDVVNGLNSPGGYSGDQSSYDGANGPQQSYGDKYESKSRRKRSTENNPEVDTEQVLDKLSSFLKNYVNGDEDQKENEIFKERSSDVSDRIEQLRKQTPNGKNEDDAQKLSKSRKLLPLLGSTTSKLLSTVFKL